MGGLLQLLPIAASFSFIGASDGEEKGTLILKETRQHSAKTVGAMLQQQWKRTGTCSTEECQVRERGRKKEREKERNREGEREREREHLPPG